MHVSHNRTSWGRYLNQCCKENNVNKTAILLTVLLLGATSIRSTSAQQDECKSCKAYIRQILSEYYSIKIGLSTRGDVEKIFRIDGGVNMRTPTRYVFKGCMAIKVDVEFKENKTVKTSHRESLPKTDIVIGLSRLYLDATIID
jgi:hypothetical protein